MPGLISSGKSSRLRNQTPELNPSRRWVFSSARLSGIDLLLSVLTKSAVTACLIRIGIAIFNPAEVCAQGTVNFSNFAPPLVDAPVFNVDGTTRMGPDWNAILYAGPRADSLAPIGPPVSFLAGEGAGYFFGGTRVIDSVPPGATAFIDVRYWWSGSGSSWETALCRGVSNTFSVVTGGAGEPPSLPSNLVGLQAVAILGGSLACIPEPRTYLLGLLALCPFLLRQFLGGFAERGCARSTSRGA
jgi:hypothetical protein